MNTDENAHENNHTRTANGNIHTANTSIHTADEGIRTHENIHTAENIPDDNMAPDPGAFLIPMADEFEIDLWQSGILEHAHREGLSISGPTSDAVAEALLSILISKRSSSPFVCPEGVVCTNVELRSFIHPWHHIRM